MRLIIDIETVPGPHIDIPVVEKIEISDASIDAKRRELAEKYTRPSTIEAHLLKWIESLRAHNEKVDSGEAKDVEAEKVLKKALLDPVQARLGGYSMKIGNETIIESNIITPMDEVEALRHIEKSIFHATSVTGWNIVGFDLPFLHRRMLLTGVCGSRLWFGNRGYLCDKFDDLMQYWLAGQRIGSATSGCSLNSVSSAMGYGTKDGDGKDWWKMPQNLREKYQVSEMELLAKIDESWFPGCHPDKPAEEIGKIPL